MPSPKYIRLWLSGLTPLLLVIALLCLSGAESTLAQEAPRISASYVCHPGSESPVYGSGFAASSLVAVSINEHPVGIVSVAEDGRFFFVINLPAITLPDTYTVAVSTVVSDTLLTPEVVSDTFTVSYDAPYCVAAREIDEDGSIIEPQSVHLPDWAHHQYLPRIGG